MEYTERQEEIIIYTIKEELAKLPEYDIESKDEYARVDLGDVLPTIFWENGKDKPIFTIEEMRKLDLSKVDFTDKNIQELDFSYTNINLDPQKVYKKSLYMTNLKGVDLSKVVFDGVCINLANLKGTGARINPQKVYEKLLFGANLKGYEKSLFGANLEGLDLSEADFDGVDIKCANLKGTGAIIDPQKIKDKSLYKTNLEGLDLRDKVFDDVNIDCANLKGTGAIIDPQKVYEKSLLCANLEGLDLSEADFDGVDIKGANLKGTRAYIRIVDIVASARRDDDFQRLDYKDERESYLMDYLSSYLHNLEGCYISETGCNDEKISRSLYLFIKKQLKVLDTLETPAFEDYSLSKTLREINSAFENSKKMTLSRGKGKH